MTSTQINHDEAPASRLGLTALMVLLLCLHGAVVFAQVDSTLTLGRVDGRLSALSDAGIAEDSPIFSNYRGARDLLVKAEVFQQERQQFNDALRTAPAEESEVRNRIELLETAPLEAGAPESLDTDELRAQLLTLRAEQEEGAARLASLDRRLAARETNEAGARERLAEIRRRIEALPAEKVIASSGGEPSEGEGIQWRQAAEHIALREERQALEARLGSQPMRYSLMASQRTEAQLVVSRLSDSVRLLADELSERSLEIADAKAMGFDPAHDIYPIARHLVDTDRALLEERRATNRWLSESREAVADIKVQTAQLRERYAIARRMVDYAADSDSLGEMLLTRWRELEAFESNKRVPDITKRTAQTVIRRIELEDTRKKLGSSRAYLDALLVEEGIDPDTVSRADYDALREVIRTYRKRIDETIDTQSLYLDSLSEWLDGNTVLSRLIKEYTAYLTGRVLWIPNFPPLWETGLESLPQELAAVGRDLGSVRIRPVIVAALYLLAALMLFLRREQWLRIQAGLTRKVAKPRTDSINHTLLALLCGLLAALPAPLLLAGLAHAMQGGSAIADQLGKASVALLIILFVRSICVPGGVGVLHFQWPQGAMARASKDARWLMYYWLPVLSVFQWIIATTPAGSDGVLLRSILVVILLPSVVLLLIRVTREAKAAEAHWLSDRLQRFRVIVATALVVLAIANAMGYVFSVNLIFNRLLYTLVIGLALLLVYALLIRWIRVTRRRLRMAQLLAAQSESASEVQEDMLVESESAKLVDVSEDSRELVNASIGAAGIAALLYLWSPLLPALAKLSEITLWTTTTLVEGETVESRISLATILVILALAALTLYAARKLPAVIDLLLRSQTVVSPSTRYTVSTLLNYSILGVGAVAAFSAMGLQWSQLQWLVAALGVGIGFGLQEIIANFISGLIILFERPIRVGDVVSAGDRDGVVARIRIRATTIVDWDGKEVLIPNKEFITGRVINWSLSDPKIRVVLPVGIAYGSNVEDALKILNEIVSSHPRVLEDPEPSIIFDAFGDNALSLVARCFLDSMENRVGVITELNREIYRRFGEAGIVIAFPQRDIHFDTDKPLRVAIAGEIQDRP